MTMIVRKNGWPRSSMFTGPSLYEDFERFFDNPNISALSRDPASQFRETENHFLLSMDMPGVAKEDLNIEIVENRITISGDRKDYSIEKDTGFESRYFGKFQGSFELPRSIDPSKIEAHLENGVLDIAIKKAESAKPKTIEVQSGKGKGFLSRLLGSKEDVPVKEVKPS